MTATLDTGLPTIVDEQALTSSITSNVRPNRPSAITASLTLGWRAMLKLKHTPLQLLDVTIFPVLMTLLFAYLFGGALAGSVQEYVQQLLPGMLVITVSMMSMYSAVGLNTDISKGIFDRFRSLSFWRPAVLIGGLMGDMLRYMIAGVVVVIVGVFLGFQPDAGLGGVALALGLLLIFAFSLSWIWTSLALWLDDAESVTMFSQMITFPLTFMSNVFVDPATMPEIVQKVVEVNPISFVATAARGLMHGTATAE